MAEHDRQAAAGGAAIVADRVVAATNPTSVLVVEDLWGDLVAAFAEHGVEARGAEPTESFEGQVDLVVCLGVVERLSPAQADGVLDRVCAVGGRVLFGSSVAAYADPANVNVKAPATWASAFAQHGLFRRCDVNLDFLGPGAALFERNGIDRASLVHRYETLLAPAMAQAQAKTSALLEAHRTIASLREEITTLKLGGPDPDKVEQLTGELSRLHDEVSQVRYDQLTVRDHIIGLEAENERLTADLALARSRGSAMRVRIANLRKQLKRQRRSTRQLRAELAAQRQSTRAHARELAELRSSRTWRAGRVVVRPLTLFRR